MSRHIATPSSTVTGTAVSRRRSREASMRDDEACWICLEGPSLDSPLTRPCHCPRDVHMKCLSRWCLQQAGRSEERKCRFCHKAWDTRWEEVLAGPMLPPADPIMVVTLGTIVHKIRVRTGPEGQKAFQHDIRRLFNIPADIEFDVTFRCKAPCTSDTIQLEGMNTYHAATHCAGLMAAQRMATTGTVANSRNNSGGGAAPLATGPGAWSFAVPQNSGSSSQPSSSGDSGRSSTVAALGVFPINENSTSDDSVRTSRRKSISLDGPTILLPSPSASQSFTFTIPAPAATQSFTFFPDAAASKQSPQAALPSPLAASALPLQPSLPPAESAESVEVPTTNCAARRQHRAGGVLGVVLPAAESKLWSWPNGCAGVPVLSSSTNSGLLAGESSSRSTEEAGESTTFIVADSLIVRPRKVRRSPRNHMAT